VPLPFSDSGFIFFPLQRSQKPVQADAQAIIGTISPSVAKCIRIPHPDCCRVLSTSETPQRSVHPRKERKQDESGMACNQLLTLVVSLPMLVLATDNWDKWLNPTNLRSSTEIGQQSYVTIGRPDGTVAEVVWPKDPKAKAGIIAYFRNSGHCQPNLTGARGPCGACFPPKEPTGSIEIKSERLSANWRVTRKTAVSCRWQCTIPSQATLYSALCRTPQEQMGRILSEQAHSRIDSCSITATTWASIPAVNSASHILGHPIADSSCGTRKKPSFYD